jgi:multidrug resistance efflux pump
VQRIPVRITLETAHDDPPLRVGMSASVEIDTAARKLAPVRTAQSSP